MAIFTRQNIGVLDNVPLDNRSTTTNTAWADEYNSYNGQLVYNDTSGFFEAYAKAPDYPSGGPTPKSIFSTAVDGVFIASTQFLFAPGQTPYLTIYETDPNSQNYLELTHQFLSIIEDMDDKTIVSNRGFAYDWNTFSNSPPNGIFVGTSPYSLDQSNKHIIAFGTGLKANSNVNDGTILLGNYNDDSNLGDYMLIVGAGTSNSSRRNAFGVLGSGEIDIFNGIGMNNTDISMVDKISAIEINAGNILTYDLHNLMIDGSTIADTSNQRIVHHANMIKSIYIKVYNKFPDDVTLDICEYNNSGNTKIGTILSEYPLGKIPTDSIAQELVLYSCRGYDGNIIKCTLNRNGATTTDAVTASVVIEKLSVGW